MTEKTDKKKAKKREYHFPSKGVTVKAVDYKTALKIINSKK